MLIIPVEIVKPVPLVAGPAGPTRVQSKPVVFVPAKVITVDCPMQIKWSPVAVAPVGVFTTVTVTGADVLTQP